MLILTAACNSDITAPPVDIAAGTYTEWTIDGLQLPTITPADSSCEYVNGGGSLSLELDGTYQLILDQTSLVCGGVNHGSAGVAQHGTYDRTGSTIVLKMSPPSTGSIVTAFDSGAYTPDSGGILPHITFDYSGHSYVFSNELPERKTVSGRTHTRT
jgi:hypothetical protein